MHSRRYTAFISYRHAFNTQEGRRWAEWLHRALERYTVPPDLIGTPNLRSDRVLAVITAGGHNSDDSAKVR